MIFSELPIEGVCLIEPEPIPDNRGFLAIGWNAEEFAARGLETRIAQANISYNKVRGTLRGMHWQAEPHGEVKLVRCTRGAIYDAAVDLRPDSPTFGRWAAAELTADNRRMLYVPVGFAHGFQTLADDCEVFYQVSAPYAPDAARGFRWDDADVDIRWPLPVERISDRDAAQPTFAEATGT